MFMMQNFGKQNIPVLIEALDDPNEDVRWQASFQLEVHGTGAKEAIPALERRLGDESKDVRKNAIRVIQTIDPERFQQLKLAGKIE